MEKATGRNEREKGKGEGKGKNNRKEGRTSGSIPCYIRAEGKDGKSNLVGSKQNLV